LILGSLFQRLADLFASLGPSDFVIRARPGHKASVKGQISRSKVPGIVGFFSRDLDPRANITVRGTRREGRLSLRFSGDIVPTDQQRVRNFLVDHLR